MQIMTLEEILSSYDWAEAFADESSGNTDKTVEAFDGVSDAQFGRADIAVVLANGLIEGDYAETDCFGLFLLKDGRYAAVHASCDTTGWDCQAGNTMTVAASAIEAAKLGLTPSHWSSLRSQLLPHFQPPGWPLASLSEADGLGIAADYWDENGQSEIAAFLRIVTDPQPE